eukprot:gene5066-6305_t
MSSSSIIGNREEDSSSSSNAIDNVTTLESLSVSTISTTTTTTPSPIIEHTNKKLKSKHVPISLINSNVKHDSEYFHKVSPSLTTIHDDLKFISSTSKLQDQQQQQQQSNNNEDDDEQTISVTVGIDQGPLTSDLHLTKKECRLFHILMCVVKESNCGSTLRVAGGWVRDKLRGDHSKDIDITLDNMMGEPFAKLVNEYLQRHHQETHRIGVIQSNPEQSKHLETATVRIFDVWIDFVNLRSETYTENSRIPEIKIGTPEEDALRRDLTINSLFYNINENRIEDYTGRGIQDLKMGAIRTPLPPLTTFLDDPLRVFRSIRFATRLYYAIDHQLMMAAADPTVKEAIKSKISHERIAKEFEGMLTGPRPDLAVHLIHELGIYDLLFSVPSNCEIKEPDFQSQSSNFINQMMRFVNWGKNTEDFDSRRIRLLTSLLIPFHNYTYQNTNRKNRVFSIIQYMLIEYLKLSNKDNDEVSLILDCSQLFEPFVKQFTETNVFDRKGVGLIMHKAGQLWRSSLAILMIKSLPKHNFNYSFPVQNLDEIKNENDIAPILNQNHQHPHHQPLCEESKKIISKFDNFCASIASHNLIGVWNIKRLLNGKQVQDLFKKPAGEWLSPVLQSILEYQLENPSKNEDDLKQFLIDNQSKLIPTTSAASNTTNKKK